jgi:hypothetical protein
MSGGRRARSVSGRRQEAGELTVEITIRAPDAASAAELRERQFAAIVRLLRRAYEVRQESGRAA